jgi:hypothetical protein
MHETRVPKDSRGAEETNRKKAIAIVLLVAETGGALRFGLLVR